MFRHVFAPLVGISLGLWLSVAEAAVIYSRCPVQATDGSQMLVDRYQPQPFRQAVAAHGEDLGLITRYLNWLLRLNFDANQVAAVGRQLEDLQLLNQLSPESTCHSPARPTTQNLAIFMFAIRPEAGETKARVRYKVCEYHVEQQRQLPLDDSCHVIGRERGYTLAALEQRASLFKQNLETARETLNATMMVGGALSSVGVFKLLRVTGLGVVPALIVSSAPFGGALYGVKSGMVDELMRGSLDFKDATEVAISGDLTTAVGVNRPMQDFLPYFERYLDSIP